MSEKNKIQMSIPANGILAQSKIKRPDFGDKPHGHNYMSILYVVAGHGTLHLQGNQYDLHPNSIVTLKAGVLHKFQDKPRNQMTVFSIYFDLEKSGANEKIIDYLFDSNAPFTLPIYYADQTKKNLRQLLHEQLKHPPGHEIGITQYFNLILLSIYRAKLDITKNIDLHKNQDSNSRVKAAIEHIANNSHEQFSATDAAKLSKVSQRQFTNICHKLTGKSFIKFLNQQRCKKAKDLIIRTDMSIASIAFEVGYEDLSTFYRAFKSIYNTSPLSVRKEKALLK